MPVLTPIGDAWHNLKRGNSDIALMAAVVSDCDIGTFWASKTVKGVTVCWKKILNLVKLHIGCMIKISFLVSPGPYESGRNYGVGDFDFGMVWPLKPFKGLLGRWKKHYALSYPQRWFMPQFKESQPPSRLNGCRSWRLRYLDVLNLKTC